MASFFSPYSSKSFIQLSGEFCFRLQFSVVSTYVLKVKCMCDTVPIQHRLQAHP